MPRINFEDNVEAQDEFWNLLVLVGGNRDVALGRLIRFFRIAQKAYGHGIPMDEEDLLAKGFKDMIESGWAVPVDGGFYALGSEDHFDWYRQKVNAGRRGGLTKAENAKKPLAAPSVATAEASVAVAQLAAAYPLAPALSPAPALKKEEEEIPTFEFSMEAVKSCAKTWLDTLQHFQIRRPLNPTEELAIARACQRFGAEYVDLALYGARYEPRSESFDPKLYVSLARIFEKDKTGKHRIEQYVNWGARKKNSAVTQSTEVKTDPCDEPPADPEKVRAILAAAGFGRKHGNG